MYTQSHVHTTRPSVALADYDFLRSTYEMLLRAPVRNYTAINNAFESLEAAHARLRIAHAQMRDSVETNH